MRRTHTNLALHLSPRRRGVPDPSLRSTNHERGWMHTAHASL